MAETSGPNLGLSRYHSVDEYRKRKVALISGLLSESESCNNDKLTSPITTRYHGPRRVLFVSRNPPDS